MANYSRIEVFKEMYKDTWHEFLPIFREFSFTEEDLKYDLEISMERTIISFSEKMCLELQKTFNMEKEEKVENEQREKENISFLDENIVMVKTIPSLCFSEIQQLMVFTVQRLKKEKKERIVNTRKLIVQIAKEYLKNKEILRSNFKISSFYEKGVYYLKINKKKNKISISKKELGKELESLKINLIISIT